MAKFENKKFIADAFVSREYKSALILEQVLIELNDNVATRYAMKTLQNFNKIFKGVKELKHKEFIGKLIIKEFESKINADEYIPEIVRTLLLNVIKTKFKIEVFDNGKGKNIERKD